MPSCKLCSNKFSFKVIIDGKYRNLCSRKYCLSCSPFGKRNTRRLELDKEAKVIPSNNGKLMSCPICYREYVFRRSSGHRTTMCNSCNANRQRNSTKKRCVEYKGGSCECCGYKKSLFSLDFHHRNPLEKEFSISGKLSWRWEKLRKELDKCNLLCRNCHGEHHEAIFLASILTRRIAANTLP